MKRSQIIHLTLLTGISTLTACGSHDTVQVPPVYMRTAYASNQACLQEYRNMGGLDTPCVQQNGSWYGPYGYHSGSNWYYVGYTRAGKVMTSGVTYNRASGKISAYRDVNVLGRIAAAVSRAAPNRTPVGAATSARGTFGSSTSRSVTVSSTSGTSTASSTTSSRRTFSSTVSRGGFGSSSRGSFGG